MQLQPGYAPAQKVGLSGVLVAVVEHVDVLFCCFTGLRHSDMVALRWKDIQKTDDGEVIHVPSMQKTKRPVIVPLGIQARKWLPEGDDASPDDKVFADAPTPRLCEQSLKAHGETCQHRQDCLVSHKPPHLRYDDPHSRGRHLHDK